MSYILDALKRSERSRQRHRPLVYRSAMPAARALPLALVVSIVVALLAGVAVALLWWRASMPVPEPPAIEAVTPAPTPSIEPTVGGPPARAPRAAAENASRPLAATTAAVKRPVPPPPPPDADAGPIPLLSAMPAEFQDRLPPMEVNIHVYSPDASQRILSINNRSYRQGDEVTGGAVVEEVVPEGVVLYYDGQRFRLPRPR